MQGTLDIEFLKYPIGRFDWKIDYSHGNASHAVNEIETMPPHLHKAVKGLDDDQLDTPYREGGWTVRQVVHHVADSHMNAYIRFKLALTEDTPVIKPYFEYRWAELKDSRDLDIGVSLHLIENLHKRWVYMMQFFTDAEWQRGFYHPEHEKNIPLFRLAALYAWHGKHHVAHITTLRQSNHW